jgi:hypothetical protein
MRTPSADGTAAGISDEGTEAPDTLESITASMCERGARVLHLGCTSCGPLLEQLDARGCRVTVLGDAEETVPDGGFAHCDRLVRGNWDKADTRHQLGGERFNAVIVSDWLMRMPNPGALIKSVLPFLDDAGYLIAVVPNVAHGTVRLAVLAGRLPPDLSTPAARHFYTRGTLEELFHASGFVIGHLDRVESDIDASVLSGDTTLPVNEVVASLATDSDALTSHFVALAFPVNAPDLTVMRERIRALIGGRDVAEQRLLRVSNSASQPENEVVIEGEKDDEQRELIEGLNAELGRLRAESSTRQTAIDDLENALRVAHDQMWVIRRSFSWRVTAPIRAIVGRLGGNTTDIALGHKKQGP